jgi:hypothetical protein
MQNHSTFGLLVSLMLVSSTMGQDTAQTTRVSHHIVVPLQQKILSGVVSGDPSKPGAEYVLRIPNFAGQIVFPHWHPQDEHITVVKGTWYVGAGEIFDRKALRKLTVGDYVVNPSKMVHFAWSETDTIIQVHGIGPFQQINAETDQTICGWAISKQGILPDPRAKDYFKFKLNDRVRSERGVGVIADGHHAEKSRLTQYTIEPDDGKTFDALEQELTLVPQSDIPGGPLSGTWKGVLHALPQGEFPTVLVIQQDKNRLQGVINSTVYGKSVRGSTRDNETLDLRIETPLADLVLKGRREGDSLSGTWSSDDGAHGTWEFKRMNGV